jgi:hypothetical protein
VWDELDEPLGFASGAAAALPVRSKRPTKGAAAIGAAVLAVSIGLLALLRRDLSLNGEPFAVAKIEVAPTPRKLVAPDTTASLREPVAAPTASAEQVEATSGVKVTRGNGAPPKALIIDVERALGAMGSSARSNPLANP